jgi:hypothetical protein
MSARKDISESDEDNIPFSQMQAKIVKDYDTSDEDNISFSKLQRKKTVTVETATTKTQIPQLQVMTPDEKKDMIGTAGKTLLKVAKKGMRVQAMTVSYLSLILFDIRSYINIVLSLEKIFCHRQRSATQTSCGNESTCQRNGACKNRNQTRYGFHWNRGPYRWRLGRSHARLLTRPQFWGRSWSHR